MVVDNYDDDEQIVVINYLAFRHSNSKSCNIVLPNGYYAFFLTRNAFLFSLTLFLFLFAFDGLTLVFCVCFFFARNSHFLFVYCASARCFMEPKFYMTDYLLSCQLTKGSALILIYFVLYISVVNCRPQAVYH